MALPYIIHVPDKERIQWKTMIQKYLIQLDFKINTCIDISIVSYF